MNNATKAWALFVMPLILFGTLLALFLQYGPLGVFQAGFPPVENLFIKQVLFAPEHITLHVFNDGPEEVKIGQTIINDVYWQFDMDPVSHVLQPLENGALKFFYPWISGEPMTFKLIASDGVVFEKEVPIAFLTPVIDWEYIRTFVLLGLYVGVIPVLLGLLWLPSLKRITQTSYAFLLAGTVGVLVFLGFDTLTEALELVHEIPETFNGVGLLVIGCIGSLFLLGSIRNRSETVAKEEHMRSLHWSYLIATGIGFHNLGEGLAIGSSYAIGEIALGGSLVIGFMIHNLTEGIAIIAPLSKSFNVQRLWRHVIVMGLIAGVPTIVGSLLGGFAYSPTMAIVFLAVGVGAIFDVAFVILYHMCQGLWKNIYTPVHVLGFFAGLCAMYATGFFVI